MARKTVEMIVSDMSKERYLGTDDGATTVPFTYLLPDGTSVNADLTPNEKTALYSALTGDVTALTEILMAMRPKGTRSKVDADKYNDVVAWITHTDGKAPGRVTAQMVERYDAHIIARDAKIAADEAAKVAARQSRQEKRDAKANADNA